MNVYVLVEGEHTEIEVYKAWIPLINPQLSYARSLDDVDENKFMLFAGFGYPGYLDRIVGAIDTVNSNLSIDRLVIAVDSEDLSLDEKLNELNNLLDIHKCRVEVKLVIQHFCIETWALGNRLLLGRNIQDYELRKYKQIFDISTEDPERLPDYPPKNINRAQFAFRYLVLAIREKYHKLVYSKRKPLVLTHPKYLEQLKKRFHETGHIASFEMFLLAFV